MEQVLRAKEGLTSGNRFSVDHRFSMSLVSKVVHRRSTRAPCQGPLPPPRVSPPRTLGDCLAMVTHQCKCHCLRRSSPLQSSSSPARLPRLSNSFETSNRGLVGVVPEFLRQIATPLSIVDLVRTLRVSGVFSESTTHTLVRLGPDKFYRPTKGLVDLLTRTGTRSIHFTSTPPRSKPPHSPSIGPKSSADVVRLGAVAAQGGRGFNPGFNPGFNMGFGV